MVLFHSKDRIWFYSFFFFFQAEDGIRDLTVTGVQTCALPISVAGAIAFGGMQMRRVVTFALVVALTYTGLGALAPAQPTTGPGTAAARLTAQASRPGFKVVRFAGYTIRVPASWPVYRLDRDPGQCVRYDRHAVYLGQPG